MCVHGTHSTLVDAEAHVKRLAKEQKDVGAYIIDHCDRWIAVVDSRTCLVLFVFSRNVKITNKGHGILFFALEGGGKPHKDQVLMEEEEIESTDYQKSVCIVRGKQTHH